MLQEVIRKLNALLEGQRAGVEAAMRLAGSEARGLSEGELKKFAEDEGWACGGLREAILRCGGTPSERTGDFAAKLMALPTEEERVHFLARGQAWAVRRIDELLAMDLDPKTRTFLMGMREEHLENIEACHRRAEELKAPPAPPYRGLPFAHLREVHDRLYYGAWRSHAATRWDFVRAYWQMRGYLDALGQEIQRSRSAQASKHLEKAEQALAEADPAIAEFAATRPLDNALSYAHHALDTLLRQYRMPIHDPEAFAKFYDVVDLPFREQI